MHLSLIALHQVTCWLLIYLYNLYRLRINIKCGNVIISGFHSVMNETTKLHALIIIFFLGAKKNVKWDWENNEWWFLHIHKHSHTHTSYLTDSIHCRQLNIVIFAVEFLSSFSSFSLLYSSFCLPIHCYGFRSARIQMFSFNKILLCATRNKYFNSSKRKWNVKEKRKRFFLSSFNSHFTNVWAQHSSYLCETCIKTGPVTDLLILRQKLTICICICVL